MRTLDEENQADGGVAVEIRRPDGVSRIAGDPDLDSRLSTLTGRAVGLASAPPDQAELDRVHPEKVLGEGLDADVAFDVLEIGAGAPPGTFFAMFRLALHHSAGTAMQARAMRFNRLGSKRGFCVGGGSSL